MIRAVGIVRLTRDPELRDANGTPVCNMRVAWNTKRKGEEKSNYLSVTAFGKTAELCAKYLSKGRECVIDGRLELDEWEKDGDKRQEIKMIADGVTFVGSRDDATPANDSPAESTDDIPW